MTPSSTNRQMTNPQRTLLTMVLLAATFAMPGVARAGHRAPTAPHPAGAFTAILGRTCSLAGLAQADLPAGCLASAVTRRPIAGDVVEYSATLRVGPGPRDVIGVHRVTRERAPFVPVAARQAVLLAHGDAWGFDAAFLANLATPGVAPDHAFPVFLARHGIDVWGIDFRWTLVPAATTDFAFMKDWGLATDVHDLGIALAVARAARLLEGDGTAKLLLLGWSRGGQTGYAYLDAETQVPGFLRQVRGFIPVDIFLKTDQEDLRQAACARAAGDRAALDAGAYQNASGQLFSTLGSLALTAPSAPSPIVPGLTNREAALLAGSATYVLLPPGQSFVPFYHFVGGTFTADGRPAGLSYTPERAWFDFERGASPYEPTRVLLDGEETLCDQIDVPFDDHLGEIRVPVFYLGVGGGFGEYGIYTTTLLGSTDVTTRVVRLLPPAQRALDLGHADIWNATAAPSLFWQPILDWIAGH
jgi:hypothetical protein